MASLYADENFPLPVVQELRSLGHDVRTTHEAGRSGQAISDDQVLADAVTERRAVVTLNRKDFIRLHRARPEHSGIVVCTADSDFIALARRIDAAVAGISEVTNQLIRIYRPSSAGQPGGAAQDV